MNRAWGGGGGGEEEEIYVSETRVLQSRRKSLTKPFLFSEKVESNTGIFASGVSSTWISDGRNKMESKKEGSGDENLNLVEGGEKKEKIFRNARDVES